jgi:hypothetical protein
VLQYRHVILISMTIGRNTGCTNEVEVPNYVC